MLFFCLSQPKIATVSRTSEKALKKQHFISLIKMWIFEKFNKEKNMEKTDSDYSTSEAFNRFSEKLGELSGRKDVDSLPKKFDLERYKGILFKDVYTVDRRNFEKYFLKILFE